MGEILGLGLGLTHYPPLIGRDEHMADILRLVKPDSCELVETWIFNSNKCFAVFRP